MSSGSFLPMTSACPTPSIETLAARGIDAPFPIQVDGDQGRHRGPRHARAIEDRVRQDAGVRHPHRGAARSRRDRSGPRRSSWCRPASSATQVKDDFADIAKAKHLKVKAVYGGTNVKEQAQGRRHAPHILIATPGRLDDLVERRLVKLERRADLRPGRGRPHARHGVPAAGGPDRAAPAEGPPDDVLLRHARRRGGPHRRGLHAQRRSATRSSRTRRPSTRPTTGSSRWTSHDKLEEARRAGARRRGRGPHARVRQHEARRGDAWRASSGTRACPRSTMHGDMTQQARETRAAAVRGQARGRAGRHRRRGARPRPRRHHAGRELRPAAGRQGLRAPRGPHRARRPQRHQHHVRDAGPAGRRQPDGRAPRPARGVRAGGHEGRAAADRVQRQRQSRGRRSGLSKPRRRR